MSTFDRIAVRLRARTWATQQRLARALLARAATYVGAGGAVVLLVRLLHQWWRRYKAEQLWRRHVDLGVVQLCLLTTEHLRDLGRIEKRTLLVKPVADVFCNEYVMKVVMEAAEKAAVSREPMLATFLPHEDKWHVLNTCANLVSSLFAPYHVFFSEARRAESYYKSAWYIFTISCARTEASGRWFVTPLAPVRKEDVGALRIRIVMMSEQELRDTASGAIEPPSNGFFNGRHESRWEFIQRFAELFQRQLTEVPVDDEFAAEHEPKPQLNGSGCGRKKVGGHSVSGKVLDALASAPAQQYSAEDNSIMRVHVPFPSRGGRAPPRAGDETPPEEISCKDVVIFR